MVVIVVKWFLENEGNDSKMSQRESPSSNPIKLLSFPCPAGFMSIAPIVSHNIICYGELTSTVSYIPVAFRDFSTNIFITLAREFQPQSSYALPSGTEVTDRLNDDPFVGERTLDQTATLLVRTVAL